MGARHQLWAKAGPDRWGRLRRWRARPAMLRAGGSLLGSYSAASPALAGILIQTPPRPVALARTPSHRWLSGEHSRPPRRIPHMTQMRSGSPASHRPERLHPRIAPRDSRASQIPTIWE